MKDRIKAAREYAGLSQGDLARAVGCTRSLVSQWEAGAWRADRWIDRIAAACGVSRWWLRTGKPEEDTDIGEMPWARRLSAEDRARVQALVDMLGGVA